MRLFIFTVTWLTSIICLGQNIPPCKIFVNQFGATVVTTQSDEILDNYMKSKEQGLYNICQEEIDSLLLSLQQQAHTFIPKQNQKMRLTVALAFDADGTVHYVRLIIQPDVIHAFTETQLKRLYELMWSIKYPIVPDKKGDYRYLGGFTLVLNE